MTKDFFKWALLLAACPLMMTSCSEDEPGDNDSDSDGDDVTVITPIWTVDLLGVSFNDEGLWADWDQNVAFLSEGLVFSHSAVDYGDFIYVTGFVPSKQSDPKKYDDMYLHPYASVTAGNTDSAPYLVAFWDSYNDAPEARTLCIQAEDGSLFAPLGADMTNTTYAYYTMLEGNDFSKKFEKGDWFKVIAHGVRADGTETTSEFYLAYTSEDGSALTIVNSWKGWNLSELGTVKSIYFTMESSDNNSYGYMNTPAYFAMKDLVFEYK